MPTKGKVVKKGIIGNYAYAIYKNVGARKYKYTADMFERKRKKWEKIVGYTHDYFEFVSIAQAERYLLDKIEGFKLSEGLWRDIEKVSKRPKITKKEEEKAKKYLQHLIFGDKAPKTIYKK